MKNLSRAVILSLTLMGMVSLKGELSSPLVEELKLAASALKQAPDSNDTREAFLKTFDKIYKQEGVEGIVWAGYLEPLVMEAMISPKCLGVENVAKLLLPQANDPEELLAMLTLLVRSQVITHMDPTEKDSLLFLKEGAQSASFELSEERLDQLLSEALVAGMEAGRDVEAATFYNGLTLQQLIDLRDWLVEHGRLHWVPLLNKIISALMQHHQNGG